MPDPIQSMPWLAAWLDVQRNLLGQTTKAAHGGDEAARRLLAFGGDYVDIAGDWWRLFAQAAGSAQPAMTPVPRDLEPLRALFTARYQRLFTPDIAAAAVAKNPVPAIATAAARCQTASRRFGQLVATIATDAFRRLTSELAATDTALPPITSLRELHELWIDCGEAAYAAAAHRDDFAEAQAELLAAFVELRFEQQRVHR